MEHRTVCGAVTETSGVRCSVGDAAHKREVGGLFSSRVEKRVLRVSKHLQWRYIYTHISLLFQVGKPRGKAALAPVIRKTFQKLDCHKADRSGAKR